MTSIATNVDSTDDSQFNALGNRTALYDESGNALVVFDATLTENHSLTSQLSRHPSESGTKISDNQTIDPISVMLSIIVTNNPIEQYTLEDFQSKLAQFGAGIAGGLVGSANEGGDDEVIVDQTTGDVIFLESKDVLLTQERGAAVGDILASLAMGLGDDPTRNDQVAFQALRGVQVNGTRLLIVTPFVSYNNMALKDISVGKDVKTKNALVADLTFEERPVFSTQRSDAKPKGKTKTINDQQQNKENQGKKATEPASDQQLKKLESLDESILSKGIGFFSG
jgi:hypothetical protein